MISLKSSDLNTIIEIIIWNKWEARDKYFLAELFLKSWFDRSTIKFLLNFSQTEIEFVSELLKKYLDNSWFIKLLSNLSNILVSENEEDSSKLNEIISNYTNISYNKEDIKHEEKKEDKSLVITWYLNEALRWIFASWIKIKKYDWLVLEWFNIINERLYSYCNKTWLNTDSKESEAINIIFSSSKNPFKIDLTTDTWSSIKDWLQNLLNWLVKYYRNPIAHWKYIKTEQEFIEAIFLLSMLLNKLDQSEID